MSVKKLSLPDKDIEHFEFFYPADSRFAEIEKIFQYIKEGNSCQLIGLPGVGRGNILNLLAYNRAIREAHVGENQKWFHFVTVDFSEVRNKPLFEVIKLMFLELVESLHERQLEDAYKITTKIFKEGLAFQDELVLFQGLKKAVDYLAVEKELTIVFLFDRFEEYIPQLTAEFFSNLRVLRNKAKYRFSVVFSLGRSLEEVLEPSMVADYYEFFVGHSIYLPLGDKPITNFRVGYLEKVSEKKIDKKTVEQILRLAGGHGKLTRLCLESVLAISGNSISPMANNQLTDYFLSQKSIQGALLEIWYFLTPEEQDDLLDTVKNGTLVTHPYLEHIFLVKGGKITIPLFEQFIKERLAQQPIQPIVFDEMTNSIKRGNDLLSDMLTASEFRLLSLLLTHKGNVITRQEIIDAVWGNLASTQGVTEQALDQLIFRLRKKIEENPNLPEHILTIKGRGIKFV